LIDRKGAIVGQEDDTPYENMSNGLKYNSLRTDHVDERV
jgi:hypothetical protein